MTNLYLEVDGSPVPITDCSWLLVAPCGCVAGITVAGRMGDIGPITNAEEAMASFTPNQEARRRDVTAGWTARLAGNGRAAVSEMVGPDGCPHSPRWGVAPTPELAGFAWAACRSSRRKHLVPASALGAYETVTVLCGFRSWGWSAEGWRLMDLVTCLRCEREAQKRNEAAS